MTAAVVSDLAAEMVAPEPTAAELVNDIGHHLEALNGVHSSLDLLVASAPGGQWGTALAHHVAALGQAASDLGLSASRLGTSLSKSAQLRPIGYAPANGCLSDEAADPFYDVSYELSELESLMEELVEPARDAGWSEIMSHLTKTLRRIRLDLGLKLEALADKPQASAS